VGIVSATVHGRYLATPPAREPEPGWLIGFHGYRQAADEFLEWLRLVPGSEAWRVVSVQALHPFYRRSDEIVASWMTRLDREHAIADNIAYVDAVIDDLEKSHGPPRRLVFAGFSQGAAMAYRAGVLGRRQASAIVAAGGDVPPELANSTDRPWPPILACTGTRDTFYTPAHLERDLALLRAHGVEARALVFEGGHEWSAAVADTVALLLSELANI
jgi:predicted esterase